MRTSVVPRVREAGRPFGRPASSGAASAGALRGEGKDDADVRLVYEGWTGEDRAPTADVVAVLQLEVQRSHRLVALDVGLLVDRELDLAVLDVLGRVGVEVEGDQLRLAVCGAHGLECVQSDRRTERDDVVDRL